GHSLDNLAPCTGSLSSSHCLHRMCRHHHNTFLVHCTQSMHFLCHCVGSCHCLGIHLLGIAEVCNWLQCEARRTRIDPGSMFHIANMQADMDMTILMHNGADMLYPRCSLGSLVPSNTT